MTLSKVNGFATGKIPRSILDRIYKRFSLHPIFLLAKYVPLRTVIEMHHWVSHFPSLLDTYI